MLLVPKETKTSIQETDQEELSYGNSRKSKEGACEKLSKEMLAKHWRHIRRDEKDQ